MMRDVAVNPKSGMENGKDRCLMSLSLKNH